MTTCVVEGRTGRREKCISKNGQSTATAQPIAPTTDRTSTTRLWLVRNVDFIMYCIQLCGSGCSVSVFLYEYTTVRHKEYYCNIIILIHFPILINPSMCLAWWIIQNSITISSGGRLQSCERVLAKEVTNSMCTTYIFLKIKILFFFASLWVQ